MALNKNKQYYIDRLGELRNEYQSNGWEANHESKTRYLYPHGRNLDDAHKSSDGKRKDEYILNNTVLTAIRVVVSGLFSGITPPLEKWFRLADEDKELNETDAVAGFYQKATDRILLDMSKSNFYTVMELAYKDLVTYSISNVTIDEDPETIFNFGHVPNGQYFIDTDSRGSVSATYRVFRLRARNVIAEYGESNVSDAVIAEMDAPKTGGAYITILHVSEKNEGRDVTKQDNLNMEWSSITYELDGEDMNQKPLRKSGYRNKPNVVPRWSVSSGNIYGNGPGDMALGDAKQLQTLMGLLYLAIEKDLKPPVIAPSGVDVNTGPNELTIVDNIGNVGRPPVEPLYRVTTDITKLIALIIDTQERIKTAFFSDLFYALSSSDDKKRTATEIIARQKELLRLMGPVTQRMTPELLQGIIHRCFDIEYRLGRLSDIPEELQGRPIKIEIISSLTKAQELSIVTPIEQLMGTIAGMSEIWPAAPDKFDPHAAIDEIKRVTGIPDGVIRSDEVVEQLAELRAAAQLREQQSLDAQQAVEGAQKLSQTDLSGDNALNAVLQSGGTP